MKKEKKVQIGLNSVGLWIAYLIQIVLDSLVVRISACHVEGPGSIPGRGDTLFGSSFSSNSLNVDL